MNPLTSSLACSQVAPLARKLAKASDDALVRNVRRQSPGNFNLIADVHISRVTTPTTVIVTAEMIASATRKAEKSRQKASHVS